MARPCFRFDLIKTRFVLVTGIRAQSKEDVEAKFAQVTRDFLQNEGLERVNIIVNDFFHRSEADSDRHFIAALEFRQPVSPANFMKLQDQDHREQQPRRCFYLPSFETDSFVSLLSLAKLPESNESKMIEVKIASRNFVSTDF